jgi:myo-inositol-1(or 4)-monophosphatase
LSEEVSKDLLGIAEAAAHAAGRIIVAHGQGELQIQHKGEIDLVTQIDLACEDAIRQLLEERSPGVPVLAEEGGGPWDAPTRWIVDPLDGTTNFVHGYPSYAVSIGLELDGVLEVGCIFDPINGQTYSARRGAGASCDGVPISVSKASTLIESLLITGFPYDRRERAEYYLSFVQAFMQRCQGIRRMGAASMDFVAIAAGRADGYWEIGLSPWDVAAGALLVQEAGGQVTDLEGGPLDLSSRRMLASNSIIHGQMCQVLRELLPFDGSG